LPFSLSVEVAKKGTVFLAFTQYVLASLEDALDDCAANRNADSLKALDEGVAIYTGSIEGTEGGSTGVLLYSNARKRCINYKTCGANGDEISGNAKVNIDIFSNFSQMKVNLGGGNCTAARRNKEAVAKMIYIPLIQGGLRYGYLQSPPGTAKTPKAEAEGATFNAAVLPVVAKCNATAATVIG
jgi:hypothetical protein